MNKHVVYFSSASPLTVLAKDFYLDDEFNEYRFFDNEDELVAIFPANPNLLAIIKTTLPKETIQ